jgi:hypothetical protein
LDYLIIYLLSNIRFYKPSVRRRVRPCFLSSCANLLPNSINSFLRRARRSGLKDMILVPPLRSLSFSSRGRWPWIVDFQWPVNLIARGLLVTPTRCRSSPSRSSLSSSLPSLFLCFWNRLVCSGIADYKKVQCSYPLLSPSFLKSCPTSNKPLRLPFSDRLWQSSELLFKLCYIR